MFCGCFQNETGFIIVQTQVSIHPVATLLSTITLEFSNYNPEISSKSHSHSRLTKSTLLQLFLKGEGFAHNNLMKRHVMIDSYSSVSDRKNEIREASSQDNYLPWI